MPPRARRSRAGLRLHDRVPRRDVRARARRDRPAAPRQCRRPVRRRIAPPAQSQRVAGADARVDRRPAVRAGRPAPRLPRQAAGGAARGHRRGGARGRSVHLGSSDRHRRDAPRARRGARRAEGRPRASRPSAGSHRAELPREAGHPDACQRARGVRRPALDRRRGAGDPRCGGQHPGAAQLERGALSGAPRGRDQRLGRNLPGHRRLRQPGARMALDRRAGAGHARGRPRAGRAACHLSRLRQGSRPVARFGARAASAGRERQRRLRAHRSLEPRRRGRRSAG